MGKLDSKKKQKQESLFNTAFELFTTKGLSKTSISDIVNKAGVAKGTFYLYFKDKYDIRNKLISHKSSEIFSKAVADLDKQKGKLSFEDQLIFVIDHIVGQLNVNKSLLNFISKNLSWGIFKDALTTPMTAGDVDFKQVYESMIKNAGCKFKNPEVMLFMIIELVSSTCYSVILYNEPISFDEYKPYLHEAVRKIIELNKTEK